MRTTRSLPLFAVAALAVAATMLLAGCPPKQTPTETTAATLPPPPETAKATPEPAAAPGEFTWTETPAVDQVPDAPLKGMIHGKEFAPNTIRVEKGDDGKCTLEISDQAIEDPTGVIIDDTGIDLDFTLPEGQAGEVVKAIADEKDFDKEHAYFHYPQGEGKGPMSENPYWGCALKIDEWSLDKDPQNEKIVGKLKGRVAIVFDDDAKSWVAGTFEAPYYTW